jgi:hypothetical protein
LTGPEHPIRARAHPWAIAAVWAWQVAVALLLAWPAASLVRAAWGSRPGGDAVLWTEGGHALLALLLHEAHGVEAGLRGAVLAIAAASVAGLVPTGALMAAIARPRTARAFVRAIQASLRAFPAMVTCGAAFLASQAAVLGAGAFIGTLSEGWAHGRLGEARAQLVAGAAWLPFLAGAVVLGVTHDLARAAIVVRGERGLRGWLTGFQLLRAAPVAVCSAWAWRTLVAAGLVAAAAMFAGRVGGAGGAWLLLLAAAHQAVAACKVALRASWLARAMRSATPQPASELSP